MEMKMSAKVGLEKMQGMFGMSVLSGELFVVKHIASAL